MYCQGKIFKAPPQDLKGFPRGGWQIDPEVAFKNVDPIILAQLRPLPKLKRRDY